MEKVRIYWIDLLRGVCMTAVLLDHTELYVGGYNIIPYSMYVTNALCIFFFLSGYLIYKKNWNIQKKTISIFRTLVLPYFIFTTIIALPKDFIHGNIIDIKNIGVNILTGQASWFVASLIIAELIFSIILWISRGKVIILSAISLACFGVSIFLSHLNTSFIWQADNALQAILFLSSGYLYRRYEDKFEVINKIPYNVFLFLLIFIIKLYEYEHQVNLIIWPISINNYPLFITDILICTLFMINAAKALPRCKMIEWTGSHSIIYYFFCGGVPLIVSEIFNRTGLVYDGNYLLILFAFSCVYLITTGLTWTVYHFFPFSTGRKFH